MQNQSFNTTIFVDQSAEEVYRAINNVRGWWSANAEGSSNLLNDVFKVDFGSHWWALKIVETVPGKKVVWLVTDSKLNFIKNKQEWTNTKIIFEISTENGETKIYFTHKGLVPPVECFDACSNAWTQYIHQSLAALVTSGKGSPTPKEIETTLRGNK